MRFSLKWILVGVAYVAVAAAAFSQTTWVYADVLWAASLLAVAYAALLAFLARGRRQAGAAGFVVASAGFVLCAWLSHGNSVPTTRLLVAAGVGQMNVPANFYATPTPTPVVRTRRPIAVTTNTPTGPTQTVQYVEEVAVAPTPSPFRATPTPAAPVSVSTWMAQPRTLVAPAYHDFSIYVRAGNAVGMMLFGGFGIVLGLLAWKAARREGVGTAREAQQIAPGQ